METAVGDDKVGRFFLHQPCYHFRFQASSVNGTPHMSVSVADLVYILFVVVSCSQISTVPSVHLVIVLFRIRLHVNHVRSTALFIR